jgi:hypothetical protein
MQSGNDAKAAGYWSVSRTGSAMMGNILSVKPVSSDTVCITTVGPYPNTIPVKGVKYMMETLSWSARWVVVVRHHHTYITRSIPDDIINTTMH